MSEFDYNVILPNGEEILMEVTEKSIPQKLDNINIEELSEAELKEICANLFSNLGWTVKNEQIITLETGTFQPDIVLSDGKKDYGFVEVITSMDPKTIQEKKEVIQVIMDKCKPDLFILTNGMVFDIFYNGKFTGSQSTPPSINTVKRNARLTSYYNALMKLQKDKKNE